MISKGKLDVIEFGTELITSKDLDPVYVLLWESDMSNEKLKRWLLAYWCFYHVGTASWITDQKNFYKSMMMAASSKEYPRGSERRHFRGGQAEKAVTELIQSGKPPNVIVDDMCTVGNEVHSLQEVFKRVQKLRGFGDWISFKVADMLECLGLSNIQFKPEDIFSMFDSPRKGAETVHEMYSDNPDDPEANPYEWSYEYLMSAFDELTAPPANDREIGIQEIETVLCKFKSHLSGRYPVGNDTKEILHHLEKFDTKTSKELFESGKRGELW